MKNFVKPVLFFWFTLISAGTIFSQSPQPVTVIRAGPLFDWENGGFLPARDILIKGNLVESVGENLPLPAGAKPPKEFCSLIWKPE